MRLTWPTRLRGSASGDFLGMVFIRSASLLVVLGSQVLFARSLGTLEFGIFAVAYSWLLILVLPAKFGIDVVILRFVPTYYTQGRLALLRGVIRFANRTTLWCSSAVALTSAIIIYLLGDRLSPSMAQAMWVVCASVPLLAGLQIEGTKLRSFGSVKRSALPEFLLRPLILASLLAFQMFAIGKSPTATGLTILNALALLVVLGMAATWVRNELRTLGMSSQLEFLKSEWLSVAIPGAVIAAISTVSARADVVMLGFFSGAETAGIYAVCVRVAGLLSFVLMSVNFVVAPLISRAYAEGNIAKLQGILSQAAVASFLVAVPAALIIASFTTELLQLFGNGFIRGGVALGLLLIAQTANALTGSVGYLLTMTGRQTVAAKIMGLAAIVNVVLNLILIPRYQMIGAALSTVTSTLIWNVLMYVVARRQIAIDPTILSILFKKTTK